MAISIDDVTSNVVTSTDGNYTITGDGVFDKLMATVTTHINAQYDSSRIRGPEYASTYLGAIQATLAQATGFTMQAEAQSLQNLDIAEGTVLKELQGVELTASTTRKDTESAAQVVLQTSQNLEVIANTDRKNAEFDQAILEKTEKWDKQKLIVDDQVSMSAIDAANKAENVIADLEQKYLVLEQLEADIAFNKLKTIITENTRNDNIRIKGLEQFAEFMKYMSAANAVPSATDFKNLRALIRSILEGIANPTAVHTMFTPNTYRYVGGQYWSNADDTVLSSPDFIGNTEYEALGVGTTTAFVDAYGYLLITEGGARVPIPTNFTTPTYTKMAFDSADYVKLV